MMKEIEVAQAKSRRSDVTGTEEDAQKGVSAERIYFLYIFPWA